MERDGCFSGRYLILPTSTHTRAPSPHSPSHPTQGTEVIRKVRLPDSTEKPMRWYLVVSRGWGWGWGA